MRVRSTRTVRGPLRPHSPLLLLVLLLVSLLLRAQLRRQMVQHVLQGGRGVDQQPAALAVVGTGGQRPWRRPRRGRGRRGAGWGGSSGGAVGGLGGGGGGGAFGVAPGALLLSFGTTTLWVLLPPLGWWCRPLPADVAAAGMAISCCAGVAWTRGGWGACVSACCCSGRGGTG